MSEHKKVDPRALRSKKMLKNAVFSLLAENVEISQLTVQKISSRAELNRATFYLHYEDINDLLRHLVHEILDELENKVEPLIQTKSRNEQDQLVIFLNCFYEYRRVCTVLVEHQGFKNQLTSLIKKTIEQRRNLRKIDPAREIVSLDIITASLIGIILWWIKDGTHYSSEYIAEQITLLYKRKYW